MFLQKRKRADLSLYFFFHFYSSPSTRLKTFSTGSLKIWAMVIAMITEGVYSPRSKRLMDWRETLLAWLARIG